MSVQRRERGGRVRWIGRYRGLDGKERSKSFEKRRDAVAWVAEKKRDLRRGDWIDPAEQKITIGELARERTMMARTTNTKATRRFFEANLGPLAGAAIGTVRASHMREWHSMLRNGRPWQSGSLSPATIDGLTVQMRTLMKQAVADGLISRSPAAGLERVGRDVVVMPRDIPTPEEVGRLIRAFETGVLAPEPLVPQYRRDGRRKPRGWLLKPAPWMALAVRLAIATGMRPSEVAGMRVRSLDQLTGSVEVVEQSARNSTETVELKTEASRRWLPVDAETLQVLVDWARERDLGPDDRLFHVRGGRPATAEAIARLMRSAVDAGVWRGGTTFHSLRHFHASALIAAGLDVAVVSRRLGHENLSTTLEVYTHLWPGSEEREREAATALVRDVCGTRPGGHPGISESSQVS
ncbi:tyrosine-type recombinase/integrase [Corynebacterium freneyi]